MIGSTYTCMFRPRLWYSQLTVKAVIIVLSFTVCVDAASSMDHRIDIVTQRLQNI